MSQTRAQDAKERTTPRTRAAILTQEDSQPSACPDSVVPVTRDSVSRNWHNLDNRLSMIAEAAYFKSEKRGFEIGHEIADWLEAEQELAEIMGET